MTIINVNLDTTTHVVVLREPTEEMHIAAVRTICDCNGNDDFPPRVYRTMIAAAPQFTSLPNPDLDLLDYALNEGFDESRIDQTIDAMRAALKRLKGDV